VVERELPPREISPGLASPCLFAPIQPLGPKSDQGFDREALIRPGRSEITARAVDPAREVGEIGHSDPLGLVWPGGSER
jgi:hypothetical protein